MVTFLVYEEKELKNYFYLLLKTKICYCVLSTYIYFLIYVKKSYNFLAFGKKTYVQKLL